MRKMAAAIIWILIAVLGAGSYAVLAWKRGEELNSIYILMAALCTYAIGFRFYSKWIATRILCLDDRRASPCEIHEDGKDFVKTNKWIVFGHHFAAISGPGPLVGPVLAAQFGYLPGTLWILIGVVLGGAVQDFVILFCSLRRDGKSLGQMVREELNSMTGFIAMLAILCIMIILLAVLGLVVVKTLAESPWGVFTVGATIPIAMLMGGYLRFWRIGKVFEATVIGVVLLLLAVWGGKFVHSAPVLSKIFSIKQEALAWSVIFYGLAASILPIWLLLAPRDYLSTFMKLGTILALALGIFLVLPQLKMPAVTKFIDGTGLVLSGKLFPFCFITIACGAISGFHSLICSGTTPKILTRESHTRTIGYGAMCLESLVAIMALIAACTLDPGIYFSINLKGVAAETVARVNAAGFPVTEAEMVQLAKQLGENTVFGRTGGAATLAVGMAKIFSDVVKGRGLDIWYHFVIMFEALFILTTLDAGTRVGRYLVQDFLGHLWKPLGNTKHGGANLLASILVVSGWGYFLIQGVRDPLGGINSLWPLFGIANQLLSAIALCLATTVILKMQLQRSSGSDSMKKPRPALALVTMIPLVWLLAVTLTAGVQKIFHPRPDIGFIASAATIDIQIRSLRQDLSALGTTDPKAADLETKLKTARSQRFNAYLDTVVTGAFLVMVCSVVILSAREWILLVARKKLAELTETPPVWLPHYELAEAKPWRFWGLLLLMVGLVRELSGEAALARRTTQIETCCLDGACEKTVAHAFAKLKTTEERTAGAYLDTLEHKYSKPERCC